ncbi:MAG: hypothetical protein HON47_03885, partial [Candidatus Diapherotrites archaeon]|nr:hypothetical protein [Candidatus Diapherotrites archaeon]
MKVKLIIALLFIIFLLGCTEMTQSEKNLCYSLTNRSYDSIPPCTTEESCYKKVDALFETSLLYEQENNIYEMKNSIARSWFYYNKAIIELKMISIHCQNGSASSIPPSINQLRFYLDHSFSELDTGMKQSFEIINFQEQRLTYEKIDLLKEEPLYESLIELRQILSELENGKTNSNSYVAFYLEKVEEFNKSNPSDYKPLIDKRPFWLSTYYQLNEHILENAGLGKNGYFPFFGNYLNEAFQYLEYKIYTTESIQSLQSFPASEFMRLYSNLGGETNSSLEIFKDLLNRTSKSYSLVKTNQKELVMEVQDLQTKGNELLFELEENPTAIYLKSILLNGKILTKREYKDRLILLKENLIMLNEKRGSGNLALGEDVSILKQMKLDYQKIIKEFKENISNENELIKSACDIKANEIKDEVKNKTELLEYVTELNYLAKRTLSSDSSKLTYCKQLVLTNEEYVLGLKDYEELKSKKIELTQTCFASVATIFEYRSFPELQNLFNELKKTPVTSENLFFFEDACEKIKSQLQTQILSEEKIKELIKNFENLKIIVNEIELNQIYFENTKFEKLSAKLTKTTLEFESIIYFKGEINLEGILPVLFELDNKIKTLYGEATNEYDKQIINFVSKNLEISFIDDFVPMAGTNISTKKSIIFNNPFHEIKKQTLIETTLDGELISTDPSILSFQNGKALFNFLPKGKTQLKIVSNEMIGLIEENTSLTTTNKTSIVQRILSLDSKTAFSKIIISTKKPFGTTKTILFKQGTQYAHSQNDLNIIFVGPIDFKEKLVVYFYILGLLSTNIKEISNNNSESGKIIQLEIKITNNSNQSQIATITLPFNYNNMVLSTTLYDEEQAKIKTSINGDDLVLKNQHFLPKQSKLYRLTVKISNIFEYYQIELLKAQTILKNYNENDLVNEISEFLSFVPDARYEQSAKALLKKAQKRIEEIGQEQIDIQSQIAITNQLEQKINELEENIKQAKKLKLKNIEELEQLIVSAKLAISSNDNKEILQSLANLEGYSFQIDEELTSSLNEMWEEITKNNISDARLEQIKNNFLKNKEKFETTIHHNPKEAFLIYKQLQKDYDLFIQTLALVEKENQFSLDESQQKIKSLKEKIWELLNLLEVELDVGVAKMIQNKFIPPITKSRLEKIKVELIAVDTLLAKETEDALENIFNELGNALDYIKS